MYLSPDDIFFNFISVVCVIFRRLRRTSTTHSSTLSWAGRAMRASSVPSPGPAPWQRGTESMLMDVPYSSTRQSKCCSATGMHCNPHYQVLSVVGIQYHYAGQRYALSKLIMDKGCLFSCWPRYPFQGIVLFVVCLYTDRHMYMYYSHVPLMNCAIAGHIPDWTVQRHNFCKNEPARCVLV